MSSVPTYLMSRGGVWYFNYRIPTSVRNRYNIKKLFIRKSLRTTNVYEAIQLSRKYTCLIMSKKKKGTGWMKISGQERKLIQVENDQELLNDIFLVGKEIVEAYEDTQQKGTYAEKTDFWMEYSEFEYECYRYAVNKINKEKEWEEQEEKELLQKHAKILADEFGKRVVVNKVESAKQKQEEETSITLNELIEKFIQFKVKKGKWRERSAKGNSEMLYVIRDFLEYSIEKKNPMIHLFETEQALQFEDEFCHYPSNCKKKFPDKSMTEIMGTIDSVRFVNVPRIATNTYNNRTFFRSIACRWIVSAVL